MAAPAISLASSKQGEAIIDAESPLSFLVGFTAGVLGIDPTYSLLAFITFKIVDKSISKNAEAALLKRERGESLGNQLADVTINFAGAHYGALVRSKVLPPAPALPTAGYYPLVRT